MNSYNVIIPVIGLFCYLFIFLSFLSSKKNVTIHSFMTLLSTMIVWTGGDLLMRLQFFPSLEFWFHCSLSGIFLFLPAFFNFIRQYLGIQKSYHNLIWMSIFLAEWAINCFTSIFLSIPIYQNGDYIFVFSWPILIVFITIIGLFVEMIYAVYKEDKIHHFDLKQVFPIFVGVGAIALGILLVFCPFLDGFPMDVLGGVTMAICMFYALYRKQLFQLNMLISRFNTYFVALVISIIIFYNFIPAYENLLVKWTSLSSTNVTLIVSFTVMFSIIFIYFLLRFILDSITGRRETAQSDEVETFTSHISHLMTVSEIIDTFYNTLKKGITVENLFIFLKEDQIYKLKKGSHTEKCVHIYNNDKFITFINSLPECILVNELHKLKINQDLIHEFYPLLLKETIEAILVIRKNKETIGFVLLPSRESGEKYSRKDKNFLKPVISIASIAIMNSSLYEQAYQEARCDYLTGVSNRRYFYEVLENCKYQNVFEYGSLIMVSVDDFKLFNQMYGNEVGNLALTEIARIIRETINDNCVVARYSGKVFSVMLPLHTAKEAEAVAKKFSEEIQKIDLSLDNDYPMKTLTVSCGIAIGQCATDDFNEVIKHADNALYYAKQAGKNRIRIYKEGKTDIRNEGLTYQDGVYSEYASTVYALTAAIDAKDHYTFSHSENVARYAQELAKAYGMNEEGIHIVYEAGLLHDIGKIGINESILNKPGKLTDEEYTVMKQHVELSIGIIRHLPSLDYVIPAVIGHHERFDGKGYPRGITGEAIPIMARILCVADSFDAMTSIRTYKSKIDVNTAIQILEEEAGHQFDPQLVSIFKKIIQDGIIQVGD